MAMMDLRVMRVGEVGINSLSMELLLCIDRREMVVPARGGVGQRGRGTIASKLLVDCSRNEMITDISRQQYGRI
jgi:hypothetical protein